MIKNENGVDIEMTPEEVEAFETMRNSVVFTYGTPKAVSARQFKLQLLSANLLDQVDAWIASQSRAVQIAFEYSGSFVRDEPMMATGFKAMGFTDVQIGAFFESASQL